MLALVSQQEHYCPADYDTMRSLTGDASPEGMLEQYKINVFGVANVTSAFLPHFRGRRSGTVIITGSRSGSRVVPVCAEAFVSQTR